MAPALRMTRSIKEKLPIFLAFFFPSFFLHSSHSVWPWYTRLMILLMLYTVHSA
ncbi:hypothetical protein F5B20DRAFT_524952 [Whalleya microplaca]|nr:hypothetical protein F5B20DRAFT_524952 [Whalleya microplaca]